MMDPESQTSSNDTKPTSSKKATKKPNRLATTTEYSEIGLNQNTHVVKPTDG